MWFELVYNKADIQNHRVFNGLDVNNITNVVSEFCRADHYLINIWAKSGHVGYVVFQIIKDKLYFKLINCKPLKNGVTGSLLSDFIIPYCHKNNINAVIATVERPAMAIKLKKLGFKKLKSGVWEYVL